MNDHVSHKNNYGEEHALEQLFAELFKKHEYRLHTLVLKLTRNNQYAGDIIQEVFLKLWNRRQVFEDIRHLKDFLYKSTRNACFDTIKGSIHSKERQAVFLGTQAEWETAADLEMIRLEVFNELHHEINQLPEQCGKIIRMGYIDGLKNDEIARELGLSVQTVKNQKSRGVMLLKRRLPPEVFVLLLLISAHS